MLVCFFQCLVMRPIHVTVLIFALHPVSELLVRPGQVLFELSLVACPVSLEFRFRFLHVPIDRFCFYLADCLPLDKIGFLVACSSSHCTAQLDSSTPLTLCSQCLELDVEPASIVSLTSSNQALHLGDCLQGRGIQAIDPRIAQVTLTYSNLFCV